MGNGLFETFSYAIIFSPDLRGEGRVTRNSQGEIVIKAQEQDFDPARRLSVVINYNMDIGDYMEHSATGLYAVDPTNEAYKFGINYLMYGMTR